MVIGLWFNPINPLGYADVNGINKVPFISASPTTISTKSSKSSRVRKKKSLGSGIYVVSGVWSDRGPLEYFYVPNQPCAPKSLRKRHKQRMVINMLWLLSMEPLITQLEDRATVWIPHRQTWRTAGHMLGRTLSRVMCRYNQDTDRLGWLVTVMKSSQRGSDRWGRYKTQSNSLRNMQPLFMKLVHNLI